MGDPDDFVDPFDPPPPEPKVEVDPDGKRYLKYDPLSIDEDTCCYHLMRDFSGQSYQLDRSWAIRRTVGVGLIELAGFIAAALVGWGTGLGAVAGLLMYCFVRGVMLWRDR